jgi:predicted nucleic-acid-binding protein
VKGIDTNILLRHLVQDDLEQAKRASRFLSEECSIEDPGMVNRMVLCDLVWVLETAYRYSREEVSEALGAILASAQLEIEDAQEALAALHEYQGGGDFADSMIASINRRLGCEHTVTFDRKAARRLGFLTL